MNVLVINAGSSSIKYQLIDMRGERVLAKGLAERVGIEGANLKQKAGGKSFEVYKEMKNHVEAMKVVLAALTDPENGAIASMDEIGAVGHRVVHGGEKFATSVIIDEEVMAAVEENCPLAPLHNPPNIMGITACQEVMPDTPMVAVFDTAFHQTMPACAYMYALPMDYYRRLKVRRYGFHGTSHRFVSARAMELLDVPKESSRIIVCHLGNGSSITAVKGGKSVDTSMGLTPLEGVVMGTRSGSIDPAIIEFLMKRDNLTIDQVTSVLNKKSGLVGLSGHSDMRDLMTAAESGDEDAQLTIDVWAYGIRKYIGAYAAAMGGVDAIVFTAGIGENNHVVRAQIIDGLGYMGAGIDPAKNEIARTETDISAPGSPVRVWVIPTNEELAIARDTLGLIGA